MLRCHVSDGSKVWYQWSVGTVSFGVGCVHACEKYTGIVGVFNIHNIWLMQVIVGRA